MNRAQTLAWLAQLQAEIGATLRAELDARGGTLQATPDRYPARLLARVRSQPGPSASERLAVYNRQYWFRLLRVLQNDLPLTAALLGPWYFNRVALAFLQAHPPRGYDLGQVTDGFEGFLERELESVLRALGANAQRVPPAALIEACLIDLSFRAVFFAPEQPDFRSQRMDEDALLHARLRFSTAFAMVEEHWPLVELRSRILGRSDERAVELPPALPCARSWALARTPRGIAQRLLDPLEARLLTLLRAHSLEASLALLEAECPEQARAALPERTRSWLARAVELGFFSRAEPAAS